jgi:hypothetical protein
VLEVTEEVILASLVLAGTMGGMMIRLMGKRRL